MRISRLAPALLMLALGACGGGKGGPATPTTPTTSGGTITNGCGAIGLAAGGATAIVNGTGCSADNSAIVKLNMRDRFGGGVGTCSGTVIAPRVVLTAAHCLDADVAAVRVWPGTGAEIEAQSFEYHSGYSPNNTTLNDVGIVRVAQDLARTPVPLLLSRDARSGESAVVVGWGRDLEQTTGFLRAGTTTISAVHDSVLETVYNSSTAGICFGDSGGPILLSEGGVWAIAGITSAASVVTCNDGTNFYASLRYNPITQFVVSRVPEINRR